MLGAALPLAVSIVTVPLYLKLVGPERYGVLAIAWLLLGYFGLFDLGLGRATSFRIASLRDAPASARADTFWTALAVNVVMGLIGALLLLAAGSYFFAHVFKVDPGLRPEIVASVPLLACAVPIATLTGVLTGAMQGREKFLETNMVSLVSTTLFQILPLAVAFWNGPNILALLGAAILARVVAILVLAQRCHVHICKGQPRRVSRTEIMPLLKYGGWINLTSLLGPLLVMVDRLAIGAILGAVSVTIYSVPFQLAQRIQILPGALTNALFPRLSALTAEARDTMSSRASRTLVALMTLPVLGAIFVIGPFLDLWIGKELAAQSAPVGRILLIGFWINSFALIPFIRLQASGRPDLVTKALLVQIPVYAAALYVVLKYFGFIGCAVLFAVRCAVDYAILSWLAGRTIGEAPRLALMVCLLILGAVLAAMFTITDWRWWVSAVLLCSVALGLGWLSAPAEVRSRLIGSAPVQALARRFARRRGQGG